MLPAWVLLFCNTENKITRPDYMIQEGHASQTPNPTSHFFKFRQFRANNIEKPNQH